MALTQVNVLVLFVGIIGYAMDNPMDNINFMVDPEPIGVPPTVQTESPVVGKPDLIKISADENPIIWDKIAKTISKVSAELLQRLRMHGFVLESIPDHIYTFDLISASITVKTVICSSFISGIFVCIQCKLGIGWC